jgi:hypothetical protein
MTDVIKIAIKRRDGFQVEVANLDEFVRMADQLMRGASNATEAPTPPTSDRQVEPGAAETKDEPRLVGALPAGRTMN